MSETAIFRFGKYNGQPISEAATPYINWLLGNGDDGQPRCKSSWFKAELERELAKRTGAGADEPASDGHAHRPVESFHEAVRVHPNAPPGSDRWMNQSKAGIDSQRLFTALATINAKLDDILVRLGEPIEVGADGEEIVF